MLNDLLRPNLHLVICGTAVGHKSASTQHYYANRGNRFWQTLFDVGLVPRKLESTDDAVLLDYGIGVTDLNKREAGNDASLSPSNFDVCGFRRRICAYRPGILAFNGKKAASVYFAKHTRALTYGRQPPDDRLDSQVWILPSTSGAAGKHWSIVPWEGIARETKMLAATYR